MESRHKHSNTVQVKYVRCAQKVIRMEFLCSRRVKDGHGRLGDGARYTLEHGPNWYILIGDIFFWNSGMHWHIV